ncbi:uncharacterized protein SPAPADRAFT_61891 [Spathaspora passalidarum NRRL Y-27907]|uniref:RING-type domain-containing protein n=1 Tax=Spathaspora passalidarum (strain NRRL Y-27907 / 11-Y1) TaxID=619300 RepID=G3ARK3_SPAPN|nr:uncharacterized protein SPAPADRAFT_61891 [Spathaspora passalidarum NRRL Y-27907]EGW31324.1 hypothetical protein SPAPADRAFT_61891 [Spathaspora passalidarum NRRL Y-27907]
MSHKLEDSKVWNELDHSLTSHLLAKINNIMECPICSEVMIIPVTAECGHSFCYGCIHQWFETKLNCPTCRTDIEHKPVLNIHLKEISKGVVDLLIETTTDEKEKSHLVKLRDESTKNYETDKTGKQLFGNLFKGTTMLIDNSDGVPRCGNCHWEAHGNVCMHCGTRFRNARNLVDGDLDGDDEDEDRFEDVNSDNDYDLDDSFIDGRNIGEIFRDVIEDYDSELDLDYESGEPYQLDANDNWHGFESASETGSFELSGVDEDDLDSSVIDALDEFHHGDSDSNIEGSLGDGSDSHRGFYSDREDDHNGNSGYGGDDDDDGNNNFDDDVEHHFDGGNHGFDDDDANEGYDENESYGEDSYGGDSGYEDNW